MIEKKWKILRVLTTNLCNYKCVYCHNEGQDHAVQTEKLSFDEFLKIYKNLEALCFEEVRFSGGEPLMNSDTIRMIEWLDENTNLEIGMATNGSLVTNEIAERLGKTRTMVTLHFPGVGNNDYSLVTKRKWEGFEKCVNLFDKFGVNYSFNYTLYPQTVCTLNNVLNYAIERGKRIKLLPFLEPTFNKVSESVIFDIVKELGARECTYEIQEKQGYHRWHFDNGAQIKIIDSPCYNKDILKCKEYGELRLLPDLSIMNCIFGEKFSIKDMDSSDMQKVVKRLYEDLKSCESVIKL